MVVEVLRGEDEEDEVCLCAAEAAEEHLDIKELFLLAIATSIDALAVGVTFAFLQVNIVPAIIIIGSVTFVISAAGVFIGNIFGSKYKSSAELAGGIILILLGILFICTFAPFVTSVFNSEHDARLASYAESGLRLYFTGLDRALAERWFLRLRLAPPLVLALHSCGVTFSSMSSLLTVRQI